MRADIINHIKADLRDLTAGYFYHPPLPPPAHQVKEKQQPEL
ncbi:MAG TPA: hypothetical protein VK203_01285 [Nostocaceae cyanobacterium]|nr:hypothetical protein [Nostocaceae cyanobacterium]